MKNKKLLLFGAFSSLIEDRSDELTTPQGRTGCLPKVRGSLRCK
jgi:hypothetical protein